MSVDRKRWGRVGIALGAAIAMGVAAAPAQAESSPGFFSAQLDPVILGADGAPGKVRPMFVSGDDATDPTVVLDLSKLTGVATAEFLSNVCKVSGSTATCVFPSGIEFSGVIPIRFRPAADADAGDTADITYTTSTEGQPPFEQKAKITIADGPDILVESGGERMPAKLGDKVSVPVVFRNVGSKAGDGIEMIFKLSNGLVADAYSNCTYADWLEEHGQLVECAFDIVVEPGDMYELKGGFGAKVGPKAFTSEKVDYTIDPVASAPVLPQRLTMKSKGGPELKLEPATNKRVSAGGADIDESDNWGDARFTGIKNTHDVASVGAVVSGQVGATVTARIGLKNNGAASLDSFGTGDPVVISFSFTVPAGVQVVTVPDRCASITEEADGTFKREPGKPSGTYYVCDHPGMFFDAGEAFLREFGLKVTSASTGAVSADNIKTGDPTVYPDDNLANNTAAVTVTVTTTGGGGTLPITGRQTGLITGTGAALLAVGALLLFAARRRGPTTG